MLRKSTTELFYSLCEEERQETVSEVRFSTSPVAVSQAAWNRLITLRAVFSVDGRIAWASGALRNVADELQSAGYDNNKPEVNK
jgi:hypothetical protein